MNRRATALLVLAAISLGSRASFGGSIDNLSNQSTAYLRTFNRNAATDAADIVFYNPAGTAMMPHDGLWLNFYAQTIFKDYRITYQGEEFGSDVPTPILPTLFAVYKWKNLAAFAGFNIPAGGGTLEYNDGVPYLVPLGLLVANKTATTPSDAYFTGSSMAYGWTLGVSYRVLKMLSLSAAARVVSFEKTVSGKATFGVPDATTPDTTAELDAQKHAAGIGGIFGIHFRPFKMLNVGVSFETETSLEFETTSTTKNLTLNPESAVGSYINGTKEKRNMPAKLAIGVAVSPIERLTVGVSYTHWFIGLADEYDDVGKTASAFGGYYVKGYDDDLGDDIDLGVGVEFDILPWLLVSAGYNHTFASSNEDTRSDFEYGMDSNSFGLGGRATFMGRLQIEASFTATLYDESQNANLMTNPTLAKLLKTESETFNKRNYTISLGIGYRLF